MKQQSDTPETDKAHEGRSQQYLGGTVPYSFAARLERERYEARKALDEILDEVIDNADGSLDAAGVGAFCTGLIRQHNSLMMGDRLSARRERDQLRKVADELAHVIKTCNNHGYGLKIGDEVLDTYNNLPHKKI